MIITAIIPTYKPKDYLFDCLKSIESQNFPQEDYEVIIVLNGCKYPYEDDIRVFINKELHIKNIVLIQTDDPGVSNARNIGIENSTGEYITFIDDDDLISKSYFKGLYDVSSPVCIGCANSYAFNGSINNICNNFISTAFLNLKNKKEAFTILNYRTFLSPPWSKLIHRDIIGKERFPVDIWKSEDSVFCISFSYRIKEMKLADDNSIYYQRLRPDSTMRRKNSFFIELKCLFKLEKEYIGLWLEHPTKYSIPLFLSRMAAGMRNFFIYIRN